MADATYSVKGSNPSTVTGRTLAQYLGWGAYPASTAGLVRRLDSQRAPTPLISALSQLPAERQFHGLIEVCDALGVDACLRRAPVQGYATRRAQHRTSIVA